MAAQELNDIVYLTTKESDYFTQIIGSLNISYNIIKIEDDKYKLILNIEDKNLIIDKLSELLMNIGINESSGDINKTGIEIDNMLGKFT